MDAGSEDDRVECGVVRSSGSASVDGIEMCAFCLACLCIIPLTHRCLFNNFSLDGFAQSFDTLVVYVVDDVPKTLTLLCGVPLRKLLCFTALISVCAVFRNDMLCRNRVSNSV
jgi:hypothetical protein